jgi:hypothetical protein
MGARKVIYYMACMQNDGQKVLVALGESVVNTKSEVGMPGANHGRRDASGTRHAFSTQLVLVPLYYCKL